MKGHTFASAYIFYQNISKQYPKSMSLGFLSQVSGVILAMHGDGAKAANFHAGHSTFFILDCQLNIIYNFFIIEK